MASLFCSADILAPPAFRDRFSFSRRFCVLYHIHRRLFHQQVQFHFMKHRRFLGVRGFVDRNCPSLYSPETLEVCRLQSSSCHADRTGFLVLASSSPMRRGSCCSWLRFFSVANRLSQAFLTTIVSRSAGESVQGEILGMNPSVTAVAQAIPPVVAGYLAAQIVAQARSTSLHCSSFCRELYSGSFLSETIELQRRSCT